MLWFFLLVSIGSYKKICHKKCFPSIDKLPFLSHCFWDFFNLVFSEVLLWCIFVCISLSLSCLGFVQLFESVVLCAWLPFGTFQPLFLQVLFQYCSFLFSSGDFDDTNVKSFVRVPQTALGSVHYLFNLFSQLFRSGNFFHSVLQFTSSVLCSLYFAVKSTHWVFDNCHSISQL